MILDIGLPDLDGIEVARHIKKIDSHAHIVMCSARGTLPNVMQCMLEGINGFVVKPFLPEVLLSAVVRLERRQFHRDKIVEILAGAKPCENCLSQAQIDRLMELLNYEGEWGQAGQATSVDFWWEIEEAAGR